MCEINIKSLEGKKFNELSQAERDAIRSAYLAYFDKYTHTKPRMKALAYCVLVGGVPTTKVGELTIRFKRIKKDFPLFGIHTDEVQTSLHWGKYRIPGFPDGENELENKLYEALANYISNEKRFADYLPDAEGKAPENMPDCVDLPLFTRELHTKDKGAPLKDCRVMMYNAAQSFNFDASSLRLHYFGDTFSRTKELEDQKIIFASV